MNESLPRAHIIRRRATFDLTRQRGRRLSNRWMTLSILPRDPDAPDSASVAFLTPKRLGPATVRNKLRRRMREIYRRTLQRKEDSRYLVWIARPPATRVAVSELAAHMADLWLRPL